MLQLSTSALVVIGVIVIILAVVGYLLLTAWMVTTLPSPSVSGVTGTTATFTVTVPATVTGVTKWVGKKVKLNLSSVSTTPLTGTITTATLSGTTATVTVTFDTASATIAAASASKYAAASTDTIGMYGSMPTS